MRSALLALALLAVATPPAVAQTKGSTREQARKHFAEGKRLQESGGYDQAIAEYQAAYALAPHPELIFNIGQCHRLKGDKRRAVEAYRRYLAEAPNGRAASEAAEQVTSLERAIAAEEAAAQPPPARPPPAPPLPAPVVAPAPPPAVAGAPPGRTLRIAGLVTAGGGGLLLAGGVLFALRASSLSNDVDHLQGTWDPELYASGQRAQTVSVALVTAGAVAVATGAVLYYLGARAERRERIAVLPSAGGIAIRVGF